MPVVAVDAEFGRVVCLVVAGGEFGVEGTSVLQHGDRDICTVRLFSTGRIAFGDVGGRRTHWFCAKVDQRSLRRCSNRGVRALEGFALTPC